MKLGKFGLLAVPLVAAGGAIAIHATALAAQPTAQTAPTQQAVAVDTTPDAVETSEPSGPDTDNVQDGPQDGPQDGAQDTAADSANSG